jgi:hypothetical protein
VRASGLIITVAAMFVLIPVVPSLTPAQPAESLASPHCGTIGSPRLLFNGHDPADLDWCQRECKDKFGLLWPNSDTYAEPPQLFGGGAGWSGTYYAYAQCIADCNTAFWKDFDEKSRDLERGR